MFKLTSRQIWLAVFSFGLIFLSALPATASNPVPQFAERQQLTSSSPQPKSFFGEDVVLSKDGKTAAVKVTVERFTGQTYIYVDKLEVYTRTSEADNFSLSQILPSTDISYTFGTPLAFSDDDKDLWIGAPSFVGSVYIYSRTANDAPFAQSQILTASNSISYNGFGRSIALSQDSNTALIGAAAHITEGNKAWVAYVFSRSIPGGPYLETQIITPTDITNYSSPSSGLVDLSADGNTALIGSVSYNGNQGAAYIFTRTNATTPFSQTQILLDSNAGNGSGLQGWQVRLSADAGTAVINSYNSDGRIHIFSKTPTGIYSKTQQINTSIIGLFSHKLRISSDSNSFVMGTDSSNKVYFFSRSDNNSAYAISQIINNPNNSPNSFGESIDWSEASNTLLIGAPGGAANQFPYGAAYVYSIAPTSSIELTGNPSSIMYGQAATFTATLTGTPYNNAPITGTVTFYLDGQALATTPIISGTGTAVFSSTTLPIGQHSIYALYNSGGNLATATSSPISIEVRTPFIITEPTDDGTGTTPGSLSYALAKAPALTSNAPVTITFELSGTNQLTFSATFSPVIPQRVAIEGTSCASPISIVGLGSTGLQLRGQNYLRNLQIKGFSDRQLIAASPGNRLECVGVTS